MLPRRTRSRVNTPMKSIGSFWLAITAFASSAAAADPQTIPTTPKPYAYGVLVGSNQGGPGQTPLRYAEDDARKVAQALKEVGRYGHADMRVLAAPEPEDVMTAIDVVRARVAEHQRRGEQAIVLFYFSGHAKAAALHLGARELSLASLRERLRTLPSTLTLVVLDACQSGAFARTKGAEPAAEFSYNSVARLTTKGTAVMASSTAQELSQESDELKSSYFTHHLLVGLRGAGDSDRDGRVTLDEAYRYAYRRTLASTERTNVGGQHVTLETDLSGQGEIPISFPAETKSQFEFPAPVDGRILVQHKASGSIVAEVHKVRGAPLRLALAAGSYETTVRQGNEVSLCSNTVSDDRVTTLDLASCTRVEDSARTKGEGEDVPGWRRELNRYGLELGFGATWIAQDDYTNRLNQFRFQRDSSRTQWRLGATLFRNIGPYFSVGIDAKLLPPMAYGRGASARGGGDETVETSSFGAGGVLRGHLPFGSTIGRGVYADAFAQASLGLASTTMRLDTSVAHVEENSKSMSLGGALGFAIGGPYAGVFTQVGYEYAPALKNELADRHNVGGAYFLIGTRLRSF